MGNLETPLLVRACIAVGCRAMSHRSLLCDLGSYREAASARTSASS